MSFHEIFSFEGANLCTFDHMVSACTYTHTIRTPLGRHGVILRYKGHIETEQRAAHLQLEKPRSRSLYNVYIPLPGLFKGLICFTANSRHIY